MPRRALVLDEGGTALPASCFAPSALPATSGHPRPAPWQAAALPPRRLGSVVPGERGWDAEDCAGELGVGSEGSHRLLFLPSLPSPGPAPAELLLRSPRRGSPEAPLSLCTDLELFGLFVINKPPAPLYVQRVNSLGRVTQRYS